MKLIRLVTEDPLSVFDTVFNEDLLIKENSKIALKSLSIETPIDVIIIDASNDNITFQIQTGFDKTIQLNHESYNKDNFTDLLLDIQNKLNEATGYAAADYAVRRSFGMEWVVQKDKDTKINIGYKIGIYDEYRTEWIYDNTKVQRVTALTRNVWRQLAGLPNDISNERSMMFKDYIATGCSFIRCRTHKYENDLSLSRERQGYIVGLSTFNISALTNDKLTDSMLTYGIAVTCTTGNVRTYFKVIEGAYSGLVGNPAPNYIAEGDVNNDFQEVIKNFENIEFNIYSNGSGVKNTVFSIPAVQGQKLYPFVVFRGGNCNLNNLRVIPSPYSSLAPPAVLELEDPLQLAASPPRPQRNPSDNILTLNLSLATFLNYDNPRQPQIGAINDVQVDFVADSAFEITETADAFLVEMLNLKLDSYDGLLNQRKNILNIIPESNSQGVLIYDAPQPIFIDINNAKDILLRNIRLRVVGPDYTPLKMIGQASMVLLID
tara:strand:- start:580 stop:2052 length:1473 start_codon:yes stop_codon:yes gene_type:complete